MGLQDLPGMEKPDNKGGRPPKEKTEDNISREVYGDPLKLPDNLVNVEENISSEKKEELLDEHFNNYWEEVWEKFYDEDGSLNEIISQCCSWSSCLGRTVVLGVQKSGAFDFSEHTDEFDWLAEYLGTMKKSKKKDKKKKSNSFLSDVDLDEDEDVTGMKALLQNNR